MRNVVTGATDRIACDGVFAFVGHVPNTGFLKDLGCLTANQDIETSENMMSCIPGVFAIGDVRKGSYRQVASAVGEAATAAIAAEHYIADLKAKGAI